MIQYYPIAHVFLFVKRTVGLVCYTTLLESMSGPMESVSMVHWLVPKQIRHA